MRKNIKNKDNVFIWVFVLTSILVNIFLTWYIWNDKIPFLENIHYGKYLVKRLFLFGPAFIVFIYWLIPIKNIFSKIRENTLPILIISLCLFLAHHLTSQMWFGGQDLRAFLEWPEFQYVENPYYPMATFYVARHLFESNFVLFNAFGWLGYFLCGLGIYFFLNRLRTNKFTSLLAGIFFVTAPTFFNDTLNMTEFIGGGYSLLLFIIATHFLTNRFYAGSVIFAAAAMEFGISRTNYIFLPLLITGMLFTIKGNVFKLTKSQVICFLFLPLLFLLNNLTIFKYAPTHFTEFNNPFINYPPIEYIYKFFATVFGVTVPHPLTVSLIKLLQIFLKDNFLLVPVLGLIVTIIFALLALMAYLKRNTESFRLILLGAVIIIGGSVAPVLFGIGRLMQDPLQLTSQFIKTVPISKLPSSYTIYGAFPTFGSALIITGFIYLFRKNKIIPYLLVVFLIVSNIASSNGIQKILVRDFAEPQKTMNNDLKKILQNDGKTKLVYTPTEVGNNRLLYDAVYSFSAIYLVGENIIRTDNLEDFIKVSSKYKLAPDQKYLLIRARSEPRVYDYSNYLRAIPAGRLEENFPVLMEKIKNMI